MSLTFSPELSVNWMAAAPGLSGVMARAVVAQGARARAMIPARRIVRMLARDCITPLRSVLASSLASVLAAALALYQPAFILGDSWPGHKFSAAKEVTRLETPVLR